MEILTDDYMKDSELIALAETTAKDILADKLGVINPKHLLRFSILLKKEIDLLILLYQVDETKKRHAEECSEDEFSPENVLR